MKTLNNGDAHQLNALTKRIHALSTNELTIHEMNNVYRVQAIMYKGNKTKALSLYPGSGRWNGQDIAMSYVANTDKAALIEALFHADDAQDYKQERFINDKTLKPREMVEITFESPLRLINVTALLPKLRLSLQDLVGDDCYNITQTLADALYAKFGQDFNGIIYSSRWSGQQLDCAAIWSHPAINTSEQTELIEYENGSQSVYDILCDDLGFDLT
ncbi:RES family NAD+ phosphorylase [Vibrio vulnificus]|nr:RES family NAD+ phosphorylase [Vibrio vulnificus]EHZ2746576.1 RES family NAD+ phosphorylase [Vibrio vulnificus]EIU7824558.1 RES family NAD+ phosphorylase [Vibrio vulnificus]ELP1869997.1 RES family NAD+ phosphorylase [Vibrio vulnificus]HAS8348836.1 RES domain-containing protein [Vibrio vulnificus]